MGLEVEGEPDGGETWEVRKTGLQPGSNYNQVERRRDQFGDKGIIPPLYKPSPGSHLTECKN